VSADHSLRNVSLDSDGVVKQATNLRKIWGIRGNSASLFCYGRLIWGKNGSRSTAKAFMLILDNAEGRLSNYPVG
jgi:hypothetical protein